MVGDVVSSAKKLLEKMRVNPRDWKIDHLETVAERYGIDVRKRGGSHVVFTHRNWVELLTVPARRPIKPVYVKKFVAMVSDLEEKK